MHPVRIQEMRQSKINLPTNDRQNTIQDQNEMNSEKIEGRSLLPTTGVPPLVKKARRAA